jgi:hypothetical protein
LNFRKLDDDIKNLFEGLTQLQKEPDIGFLKASLDNLVDVLYTYYGKEVVVLIDEYDSMVTHAIGKGYEKELCEFLSGFFGNVFKGNGQVEFVVLAGCLRIAKESIFTGANNLVVSTVSEPEFSGMFGLSEGEMAKVLDDFGLSGSMGSFREWYNGYLFCGRLLFNTSSVLSYCRALLNDGEAKPQNFWANASGNDILNDVINKSESEEALPELESLLLGGSVEFELRGDITLDDFSNIYSLWSVLVHSGYLTPCGQGSNEYRLPNKEVQSEFARKVVTWVKNRIGSTVHTKIIKAIWGGNSGDLKDLLERILMTSTSFFDQHEYCYHMLLLGLIAEADPKSNRESGNGRTDITLKRGGTAAILELKKCYAELCMTADALKGIMQIRDRLHGKELELKGLNIIHFGVSFFKKGCYAILESEITKDLIAEAIGDMEAAALAVRMQIDKREADEGAKPEDFRSHRRKKWYKDRRNELEALADTLDNEGKKFKFAALLKDTEKLLDDLKWLQKAEAAKMPSQTLLQSMLIHEKFPQ